MRTHQIVMWPAPLYNIFPHYLINGDVFEKKVTEHKMCVLIFSNISHSKKNSARLNFKKFCWSSCKAPVNLVRFQWNLNFLRGFSKNPHISFRQNPSSGSWDVPCGRRDGRTDRQTDRRTDVTTLRVAFRNFANVLKKLFRPTFSYRIHSWANSLVLTLLKCPPLLKCTALTATCASQRYWEAADRMGEACCVGVLLLVEWLDECVGEWVNEYRNN